MFDANGSQTFSATVTVDDGTGPRDLLIELPSPDDAPVTGADLYSLLRRIDGNESPLLTVERTGQPLARNVSLVNAGLVSGDRLTAVAARPSVAAGAASDQITFRVLTGPEPGSTLHVRPGFEIGRATSSSLEDASVSREQFRFGIVDGVVTVEDRGSVNTTVVNGRPITPRVPVEIVPGDIIEAGHIALTLVAGPPVERDIHHRAFGYMNGSLGFQQAPRAIDGEPRLPGPAPEAPAGPPERRFPLAAAIVPLVLGAVMAVVLEPMYALFVLVSPLMVVWMFLDDRRSGRRDFVKARGEYEQALAVHRLAVADYSDQRAAWRRHRTPSLTQVARWTRTGSRQLWSRRPAHRDFLTVAVGQADQPLGHDRPTGEPAGAPPPQQLGHAATELRATAQELLDEYQVEPAVPVVLDLQVTPIVGITGAEHQAAAVAASIVGQLVGLRSPRHLKICVLAPGHESLWSWTKWLPHVAAAAEGPRPVDVAGTDDEALALFRRLEELVAERRQRAEHRLGGDDSPHVVVVIQTPLGLAPAALAAFLSEAKGFGVSVLYLAIDRVQLPAETDLHVEAALCEPEPDENAQGSGSPNPAPMFGEGLSRLAGSDCLEVTTMANNHAVRRITPWRLDPAGAEDLARDLAPLIDLNTAAGEMDIPAEINFQEAIGHVLPQPSEVEDHQPAHVLTADRLIARWAADRPGLLAVIGASVDGPIALDLKTQGPHALVAGTTGSGKSEFLQSMVVGLAANYSPSEVNFILIDYKGGAAFRQCRHLPHTVGFVTDLDDHLAHRALISLRAELRRREEVLAEAGVSDLSQMADDYRHTPDEHRIPASLVVIVDEFAALQAEVPDFVNGLVDVAQRGRSMGVHMVLATQKPAGVITAQIEANTNIRVALRVANDHESSDIIGSSAAADIDTGSPGRAYLKIGGGDHIEQFQSTFVGGPLRRVHADGPGLHEVGYGSAASPIPLAPPDRGDRADPGSGGRSVADTSGTSSTATSTTEIDVLVTLAQAAWAKAGVAEGRRLHQPWLPVLSDVVALPDLLFPPSPNRERGRLAPISTAPVSNSTVMDNSRSLSAVIGVADLPSRQAQAPLVLDIAHAGHVAVYGTSGSGKTTLARSLVCSLTASAALNGHPGPDIMVVDGGGALADLRALPLVTDVVPASDGERVQLVVDYLRGEVDARLSRADRNPMLLVIDGFGSFWATLQSLSFGRAADGFARLLAEMPGAGMHAVMTADQRSAIPHQCLGPVGLRLVQRMSSVDEYRSVGVRTPPSDAGVGRTLIVDAGEQTTEMQTAVAIIDETTEAGVGDDAADADHGNRAAVTVQAQVEAVDRLAVDAAAMLAEAGVAVRESRIRPLPDAVTTGELIPVTELAPLTELSSVPFGVAPGGRIATANLQDNATLLVVGPAQSGKSTVLRALRQQTEGLVGEHRLVAVKRSSPSAGEPGAVTNDVAGALQAWADELSQRTEALANGESLEPIMILIDDADDLFDDAAVAGPLTELVLNGRDGAMTVVASATAFRTVQAYETWIRAMRSAGYGVVLQPDGDRDEDVFDCRFPRGVPTTFPAGRGYLVDRSEVQLVQTAAPAD